MPKSDPVLFGASYSVYVRICRMALAAKGVHYTLQPVDIFAEGGPSPEHLRRHPFGKIPAFRHGDVELFETDAIVTYVSRAFDGPALEPEAAEPQARMRQIMRIVDNYAYPRLVWKCYVPETDASRPRDEDRWQQAERVLEVVEGLAGSPWLIGDEISLADIYLWPVVAYFSLTWKGGRIVAGHKCLHEWSTRMKALPVSQATRYEAEIK